MMMSSVSDGSLLAGTRPSLLTGGLLKGQRPPVPSSIEQMARPAGLDPWWQKQREIQELQETSQGLLRRVGATPSHASSPSRLLDEGSVLGSGSDRLGSQSGVQRLLSGSRPEDVSRSSLIVPLALMSSSSQLLSAEPDSSSTHGALAHRASLLPNAEHAFSAHGAQAHRASLLPTSEPEASSTNGAKARRASMLPTSEAETSSTHGALARRASMLPTAEPQASSAHGALARRASAPLPNADPDASSASAALARRLGAGASGSTAVGAPAMDLSSVGSKASQAELRTLQQENASLRQEVMELRRAGLESDKELCLQTAAARRGHEMMQKFEEAERRVVSLSDEVENLRKSGDVAQLMQGDQSITQAVRTYLENDMAAMRAERRAAEQVLRVDLQNWKERSEQLEIELQSMRSAIDLRADNQAEQRLLMNRKVSSLEIYAQEVSAARSSHADAEVKLQAQVDLYEAERQALEKGEHEDKRRMEEVRRTAKRKMAEMQQQSEEAVAEAEQLAAKAKEAERALHIKLSDARQEKMKMEGRLKKQIQTLEAKCRDAGNLNSEAQVALEEAGNASEASARAIVSSEECVVFEVRFMEEKQEVDALKSQAKWAEMEARNHLQMELVKEHSRTHDEAWERLSAVEDRHSLQIRELQQRHITDTEKLMHELREKSAELERIVRVGIPHGTHFDIHGAYRQKGVDMLVLESTAQELTVELAAARQEAETATQQHEALLSVLRRERDVADNQFQQLVRHTEEKQRAIHNLQNEVEFELRADAQGKSSSPSRGSTCPTRALPPLVAPRGAVHSPRFAPPSQQLDLSRRADAEIESAPSSADFGTGRDMVGVSGGQDDSVVSMLSQLQVERDVHETRRAAEELARLLSANRQPGADAADPHEMGPWQRQALQLAEKLLLAYEHSTRHASDESLRVQAARQREASLREFFSKTESRTDHKHEHEVHVMQSRNQNRLLMLETEAVQMEQALQSAFESERSAFQAEANRTNAELRSEISEYEQMKNKCEVLENSQTVAIQCRVDAAEARMHADTREEFAEVKWKAQADIVELRNRHANALEKLGTDHSRHCELIDHEAMDEHEELRSELQELSRALHKELKATADEHGSFVKQESKLEAKFKTFKQDQQEAQMEVHETKLALERELVVRNAEIQGLESTLQVLTRKDALQKNEWSADRFQQEAELERLSMCHAEDREVLAREITVFQDERLLVDEKLREHEALAESRQQVFREELEDVEIDLQRTEAVCAERGRLLENHRRGIPTRSPPRSRAATEASVPMGNSLSKRRAYSMADVGSDSDFPHGASSAPSNGGARVSFTAKSEFYQETLRLRALEKDLSDKMHTLYYEESEAAVAVESAQTKCEQYTDEFAQSEKDFKAQLGQLREDKLRERQMKDRQIDKLKSRVSELVTASEQSERKQLAEAAQQRRQNDESGERLAQIKTERKTLRGTIQETQSERTAAQNHCEALQHELSKSEDLLGSTHQQCQELAKERFSSQEVLLASRSECQELQAARGKQISAVADLEMQLEHARRHIAASQGDSQEARSTTERVCQVFSQEIKDVLPMLPELEAQELADQLDIPSEESVVACFKALANYVSELARKNAELRSTEYNRRGTGPTHVTKPRGEEDNKRQTATLQKDIVKLREENQEVRLENHHLQTQLRNAASNAQQQRDEGHCQPHQRQRDNVTAARNRGEDELLGSPGPSRGSRSPVSSPVLEETRSSDMDDLALKGQKKSPNFGSLNNVEMRLKLRQLNAEKVQLEQTAITYKQELKKKVSEMSETHEDLKAQLWESQHERENESDLARKQMTKLDRKVKYLEGKLQDRLEMERQLIQEKDCVEEQLNLAAKQLEALLAEEGRDGDLQRDLAGLSHQFEQLHGKHSQQLSKAQEMSKALEREREKRLHVEEQLHSHEMQIDRELRLAHERHMEQMNNLQDQMHLHRKSAQTNEKALQESMAEHTKLSCETSTLRSLHQQHALSVQELQDEVQRLHEELNTQSQLLRDARDKGPGAKDALQKLRQKEGEREELEQALMDAEGNLKRAQAETKIRVREAEDLQRENEALREDARRREGALRVSQESLERQDGLARLRAEDGSPSRSSSRSPPRQQQDVSNEQRGGYPAAAGGEQGQGYPDERSRSSRRPADLSYERHRGAEESVCVVRTAEDSRLDGTAPSRGHPFERSPSQEEVRQCLEGQDGLLSALDDIQHELNSRERELHERKAGLGSSRGGGASSSRSFPSESLGIHASLAEVEHDFQQAGDFPPRGDGRPPSPPRMAPIAADVKLKDEEGRAAAVRGCPDTPPRGDSGGSDAYPQSPGRGETWLADLDTQASAPSRTSQPSSSSSRSKAPPVQTGLPSVVRDTFRQAEALCERSKFDEAVPCFQQVLSLLEGGSPEVEGVQSAVIAEVWAHLGVAMQSLDRVREAIESYKCAVTLDGSLHVCFANLATLHQYLNEYDSASEYIAKALALDQNNPTYNSIRDQLHSQKADAQAGPADKQ